jgi:hypothetical protein
MKHAGIVISLAVLVSLPLVAAAALANGERTRFFAHARDATGTVTALGTWDEGGGHPRIHARVRFKTQSGQAVDFWSLGPSGDLRIGAQVSVRYDQRDPSRAFLLTEADGPDNAIAGLLLLLTIQAVMYAVNWSKWGRLRRSMEH